MNKKKLLIGLSIAVFASFFVFFVGSQLISAYYLKQGTAEFIKGDFVKAESLLGMSLKFNSKNSEPHFYLGKIALGKITNTPGTGPLYPNANYANAAIHFEKAIASGLERKNKNLYFAALNDVGFSYWVLGKREKATQNFLLLIEKNTTEQLFTARRLVAFDYFDRLNKPDEGLKILLPALVTAPATNGTVNIIREKNLFRVYTLLALLNVYFQDYANTEKYAKLAIESAEPQIKSWEIQTAHALLAVNYGRQKDFTSAELEIKKANNLAGAAGAYNCFLANSYAAGENYSKAISVAEKSDRTANTYNNSVCLRALAISYLAKGDKIKTKKYMEEYLSFTEKFSEKNIFVVRNREQFDGELLKLK